MQDWAASVTMAQRGDLAAFDQVVRRFQHMAVGYAYSLLGDMPSAEDAAQEALIQAYQDLPALREPHAFPAWLRRIVLKHCDRLTRRKRLPTVSLEDSLELPDRGRTPLEQLQRRETQREVLAALNALPENERAATTLFYIDGYSLAEVGEFLEVPVSTVKNRLYSARQQLRERMVATVEETLKRNAPGDEFAERVRTVLEGVPRVNFYDGGPRCPEDFTFPAALRACLEFLGEPSGCKHASTYREGAHPRCTYAFVNGISGMAFRLLWNASAWDFGNNNILCIAADPIEPVRRAFEAAGYGFEAVFREAFGRQMGFAGACCEDEARYRRQIVESLRDRGRPVLAIGVVGPPEFCVVTGYDERGDVLLGWSFFQAFPEFSEEIELEPSGHFRRRNWFANTQGLILIGEKREKPPLEKTHRQALQWALEVMRTPRVGPFHAGLAAYTGWTEALLRDQEFPAGDMDVLRMHYGVHYDAVGNVAEGRHYGAEFLQEMAELEPAMAAELKAAEACFRAEHDLMWEVWNLAGGNAYTDEQILKLAEAEVRRRIVPVILQARDKDVEAAEHIERALRAG